MKKALLFSLALLLCFSAYAPALATADEDAAPYGIVSFSYGMPKDSGTTNQYNPYATARPALPEQITVGFVLFKIVNGTADYVTSATNSDYGTYITVEDFVNLSSGEYKLHAYYKNSETTRTSDSYYTV